MAINEISSLLGSLDLSKAMHIPVGTEHTVEVEKGGIVYITGPPNEVYFSILSEIEGACE